MEDTLKVGALYATSQVLLNGFNLLGISMRNFKDKLGLPQTIKLPEYEEPFIKHSLSDLLAPTVPVDRLVRGTIYLNRHGGSLLTKS